MAERKENCGNCSGFELGADGQSGLCHGGTPQVVVIGFRTDTITNHVDPIVNSYWPPTSRAGWCLCHKPTEAKPH